MLEVTNRLAGGHRRRAEMALRRDPHDVRGKRRWLA